MKRFLQPTVLLMILVLILSVTLSCDKDSFSPTSNDTTKTPITVSGYIYYSGIPFGGINIFLKIGTTVWKTQTDENGIYTFDNINPGDSCLVSVVKDGFRFIPSSISFVAGEEHVVLEDITAVSIFTVDNVITFKTIPGGTFSMGSDFEDSPDKPEEYNFDYSNEQPVHTVTVNDFEMSVTEITEDQYARFLTNACAQDLISVTIDTGDGGTGLNVVAKSGEYSGHLLLGHGYIGSVHGYAYDSPHNTIQFRDGMFTGPVDIPVKNVSWYGAKMFAEFHNCDLPTEAEWEYACRGGMGYDYGTDDGTIDLTKANYQPEIGPPAMFPALTISLYPPNPFGIYDLSGNLFEWCNDYFDASYYTSSPSLNPAGPETGTYKVIRGGGYASWAIDCRASFRIGKNPGGFHKYLGFRVVRRLGGVTY